MECALRVGNAAVLSLLNAGVLRFKRHGRVIERGPNWLKSPGLGSAPSAVAAGGLSLGTGLQHTDDRHTMSSGNPPAGNALLTASSQVAALAPAPVSGRRSAAGGDRVGIAERGDEWLVECVTPPAALFSSTDACSAVIGTSVGNWQAPPFVARVGERGVVGRLLIGAQGPGGAAIDDPGRSADLVLWAERQPLGEPVRRTGADRQSGVGDDDAGETLRKRPPQVAGRAARPSPDRTSSSCRPRSVKPLTQPRDMAFVGVVVAVGRHIRAEADQIGSDHPMGRRRPVPGSCVGTDMTNWPAVQQQAPCVVLGPSST